jgi:hypothetical protein
MFGNRGDGGQHVSHSRKLEEIVAALDDLSVMLDEIADAKTKDPSPQLTRLQDARASIEKASEALEEALLLEQSIDS